MLRFNVRNSVRFVAVSAIVAVGLFIPASSRAGAISVDGSVFSDDFTGATLDGNKWLSSTRNGGSVTMDGVSSVEMSTEAGVSSIAYMESTSALNFGSSPNDWGVEVKFQVQTASNWSSTNDAGNLYGSKQFSILTGVQAVDDWTAQGFDLRAMRWNGDNWYLGWYGWDNSTGNGGNDGRVAVELTEGIALGSTLHTATLHRKSDGNVDIYLDDNLIGTQALIGGSNPVALFAGDVSSMSIAGRVVIDSIKIGAVPEPSSLILLVVGGIGLLAYAWRKQK